MEYRTLGRTGHASSVLIFGAASLWDVDQATADATVEQALAAGINHFDVAASYGIAEERLGGSPLAGRWGEVFLATKTGDRDAEAAWASINRSLERLKADRVDLIQLHEVSNLAELDKVTATGGALEALVRAREEGLVSWIGVTGHTHAAPGVHREALRRFDFDTVLTPLNRRLWAEPGYADDFRALAAECADRSVGLMTIKMIARGLWDLPEGQRPFTTWYRPFDSQELVTAAITWLLEGHPEVTGLATAGDPRLLPLVIRAEQERMPLARAEELLSGLPEGEYESPFAPAS